MHEIDRAIRIVAGAERRVLCWVESETVRILGMSGSSPQKATATEFQTEVGAVKAVD